MHLGPKTCQNKWGSGMQNGITLTQGPNPKIPKLLVSAHEVFFEEFICLGLQNCVMHRV